MLLSKFVKVKWNFFNKDYYVNKGYIFTKMKDEFEVSIENLSNGSSSLVECICDYCNETIIEKSYDRFLLERKITNKDCCNNKRCQNKKRQESIYNKYNVTSARKLDFFNKKSEITCLDKYGCKTPFESEKVKEKIKNTCIEKFGVDHISKSEEIKKKKKQTCFNNFGVENPLLSPMIREKVNNTNIKRYGFKNPMQNQIIGKKSKISSAKSRYNNNSTRYSNQQKYICNILNGKLNYPIDKLNVDILLDDNIIIEYNGGGHDLVVKLKGMSNQDFKIKESRRNSFLISQNYKIISIICTKDNIPYDNIIIQMVLFSKKYFNSGHSWIKFDIDNGKVITSQFEKNYKYGELRKIKDENLQ